MRSTIILLCNLCLVLVAFKIFLGNSLVVQWLGLGAFTAMAWVQTLVGELRSHFPQATQRSQKNIYIYFFSSLIVSNLIIYTFNHICEVEQVEVL